ncbi:MAG: PhnD/SsuA/transferrin family substrate-binding protein [Acidobacteria bacterium]|nr:PhnD/SsuA/transferrin family substrate-binding protein [Acidobacteriota bacterium]
MIRLFFALISSGALLAQHYEIVNMGVASRERASNVFGRYTELVERLKESITNEGIQGDVKLRILERESDITSGFANGSIDVAVVSPITYLVMRSRGLPVDIVGAEIRYVNVVDEAVIVTPISVSIQRLDQLQGRSFALGPANDPLFDWCARAEMAKVGLNREQVTLKSFDNFERMSEMIQMGRYQAGILPKSFVTKPDHPFRVLAECKAPNRLWVIRRDLIPFTRRGIEQTLLEIKDPRVLNRIGIEGIDPLDEAELVDLEQVVRKAMVFNSK